MNKASNRSYDKAFKLNITAYVGKVSHRVGVEDLWSYLQSS